MSNNPSEHLTKALDIVLKLRGLELTPDEMIERFVEKSGLPRERIISRERKSEVVFYREGLQFLLYLSSGLTHQQTAELTGCRNHATVIHNVGNIRKYLSDYTEDRKLRPYKREIKRELATV